ncbi:MAG: hypothetical protein GX624_06580 [Actinobacteria bacterium]|nr:hypothetical protein [Actinomycetota bacterium]
MSSPVAESRPGPRGLTFVAADSWLRTRRGLVALWLATTAAVAVVTVLMQLGGVPGWDDAAHAYKVLLLRDGDSVFWDTYWYGGGYGAITYGFVFYWLAQYVSGALIVILAAGTIPLSFYLYQRDMWRIDDVWPAWGLALVMALYLAHGQDPFVLALALTLGGLALLARGRPLWAALSVAVGIFANPMGLVVVVPFVLTDLIVRPAARRRYVLWAAALSPAVVLRFAIGLAFSEPGSYLNETSQLMVFLGFALVGLAMAGVNAAHPRRQFVVLFLVYGALCVGSFVTPGSPLGNNIGRFFMVFGLPLLLLLRRTRLRRPFRHGDLAWVAIVAFGVLQLATVTSHFLNAVERPQTTRAYFAPALAAARELYDPDYRFHVVALRRHWEALYFPEAGYPIARGWYRQADAIHNGFFYSPYNADEYVTWLRSMGVEYIFSPTEGPLDPWSRRESRLLESSPAFTFVEQAGVWRIYRLLDAEPILVPERPQADDADAAGPAVSAAGTQARGDIGFFGHERLIFSVTRPGTYWLKVTSSPYWVLEGPGEVEPRPDRFMDLHLRRSGTYTLRFRVTPAKTLEVLAGRFGL